VNGQIVKLRTTDGVHFTKAGARKLAHFVEGEIRRRYEEMKVETAPALSALPAPGASEGRTEVPGVEPPKPLAGPILPLNAPPVATDGQLTGRMKAAAPASSARTLIDRVMQKGEPISSKPGRSDDFVWPPQNDSPQDGRSVRP
jgi:hypothetical protein